MDPNANLTELLELAHEISEIVDNACAECGRFTDDDRKDLLDKAPRMAELLDALNTWILRGAFLPTAWQEAGNWTRVQTSAEPKPMTLQEAARTALDVQSASNLSGVLRSWVRAHDAVRANTVGDTSAWNAHPVDRLYAEQAAHLTAAGVPSNVDSYCKAAHACEVLAQGGTLP